MYFYHLLAVIISIVAPNRNGLLLLFPAKIAWQSRPDERDNWSIMDFTQETGTEVLRDSVPGFP